MKRLRVVCMCSEGASIDPIMNSLSREHEVVLLIVPQYNSTKRKKKTLTPGAFLSRAISKVCFKLITMKPAVKKVEHFLQDQGVPLKRDFDVQEVRVPAHEMNHKSTAELISRQQADVMFVCGAPILKESIFNLPKYGSINFHFGYSPKYCGHHTLVWAFIRGDFENVAGTFLKIDAGVDTGSPLAFVFPEITGADTIETAEGKLVMLANKSVGPAVQALADQRFLDCQPSNEKEEIRHADYTPLSHLSYYSRIIRNRLFFKRTVLSKERVVTPPA